eukprot:SAG31_NODE_36138_length_316_cov_0.714286_1_plen_104_part_01
MVVVSHLRHRSKSVTVCLHSEVVEARLHVDSVQIRAEITTRNTCNPVKRCRKRKHLSLFISAIRLTSSIRAIVVFSYYLRLCRVTTNRRKLQQDLRRRTLSRRR